MLRHQRLTQAGGNVRRILGLGSGPTCRLIRPEEATSCRRSCAFLSGSAGVTDFQLKKKEKKEKRRRSDPKAAQETLEAQFVKFPFCRMTAWITPASSRAGPPLAHSAASVCVQGTELLREHTESCRGAQQSEADKIKKAVAASEAFFFSDLKQKGSKRNKPRKKASDTANKTCRRNEWKI